MSANEDRVKGHDEWVFKIEAARHLAILTRGRIFCGLYHFHIKAIHEDSNMRRIAAAVLLILSVTGLIVWGICLQRKSSSHFLEMPSDQEVYFVSRWGHKIPLEQASKDYTSRSFKATLSVAPTVKCSALCRVLQSLSNNNIGEIYFQDLGKQNSPSYMPLFIPLSDGFRAHPWQRYCVPPVASAPWSSEPAQYFKNCPIIRRQEAALVFLKLDGDKTTIGDVSIEQEMLEGWLKEARREYHILIVIFAPSGETTFRKFSDMLYLFQEVGIDGYALRIPPHDH